MLKVRRLFDLFGNNYEEEEKWILLDFMISCQMCFQLNDGRETSRRAQSDKYIFPKFLPEQPAEEVRFYWKERAKNTLMVWQKLPWINYYLMQSFITQLGRKTTLTNIWRNGIHISTPEGYFLAELDYPNKEFTIWIEASAAPAWLPQILEAFDYREEGQEWKISHDNRQTEALFELEKWQKEQDGPAGKGAMKEAGFENLGEVKTAQNTEIILLLTAVPLTLTKINHNNEYAAIDEVLKARSVRDKFTLVSVNHTTIPKMIEQITTEHPSILHFVGHGEEDNPGLGIESGLMFHPTDGNIQPEKLKAKEAHDLFKRLKEDCPSLKIVFLNACYSEDLAKAISEAGLSVIGTSTEILSPVAVRFATGFYGEYTRQETTNLIKAMRHGITLATATAYQASQEFHLFENGERIALA